MTMVEKVARALSPSAWHADNADSKISADMRERSIERARAAIAAMREPSQAVECAIEDEMVPQMEIAESGGDACGLDVWNAGIDAALAEEPARV